jgi:hypothetical protein
MHPTFAESIDLDLDDAMAARPVEQKPAWRIPTLCQTVAASLLRDDAEFKRFACAKPSVDGLADFLFASSEESHEPKKLFKRLRWGGLCLVASRDQKEISELAQRFERYGFAIERGPTYVREGRWPIPIFNRKVHGFIARKIDLIAPGEITNRFTYHVQLARHDDPNDPIVVQKEVPSIEQVVHRLSK